MVVRRPVAFALALALLLALAAQPAFAGKRPPIVVAVDKGDAAKLAKLVKKAKPKDLDAFDADTRSPTAGMRAIEVAARKGDRAAVELLLGAGATATAKALEQAAGGGHADIVKQLVEHDAPRADLALTAAAKAGYDDVVEFLLPYARKADPYFNLDQVLEFAVFFPPGPSTEVVKLLLREKANPAIAWGPGKQTVLHMAIVKGATDVVTALLEAKAPVNAEDGDGMTPLLVAVASGQLGFVEPLLAAGADARRVTPRGMSTLHLLVTLDAAKSTAVLDRLLAAKVPIDLAGKDGVTALMTAAVTGSAPWVDLLLARGAKAGKQTTDGRAAIDFALTCAMGGGAWGPSKPSSCHGEVALRLLQGAKAPTGTTDKNERTPLVRAILTGNDALVARMIALGVHDGSPDRQGNGPFHYAALFGTPAMVKALVDAKVGAVGDPNDADETPLTLARRAGRTAVADALVAAGATR